MEDNVLPPNPMNQQPAVGGVPVQGSASETSSSENIVPGKIQSFLGHFGLRKEGNNDPVPPRPDTQLSPQKASGDIADFYSRLGIDSKPPNPVDDSMRGVDVVKEPLQANGSGLAGSGAEAPAGIGEIPIESITMKPSVEKPSTLVGITPDLTNAAVNAPAQAIVSQLVGEGTHINSPDPKPVGLPTESTPAISVDVQGKLDSVKESFKSDVDALFAEISQILKANSAGVSASKPAEAPKELVGSAS